MAKNKKGKQKIEEKPTTTSTDAGLKTVASEGGFQTENDFPSAAPAETETQGWGTTNVDATGWGGNPEQPTWGAHADTHFSGDTRKSWDQSNHETYEEPTTWGDNPSTLLQPPHSHSILPTIPEQSSGRYTQNRNDISGEGSYTGSYSDHTYSGNGSQDDIHSGPYNDGPQTLTATAVHSARNSPNNLRQPVSLAEAATTAAKDIQNPQQPKFSSASEAARKLEEARHIAHNSQGHVASPAAHDDSLRAHLHPSQAAGGHTPMSSASAAAALHESTANRLRAQKNTAAQQSQAQPSNPPLPGKTTWTYPKPLVPGARPPATIPTDFSWIMTGGNAWSNKHRAVKSASVPTNQAAWNAVDPRLQQARQQSHPQPQQRPQHHQNQSHPAHPAQQQQRPQAHQNQSWQGWGKKEWDQEDSSEGDEDTINEWGQQGDDGWGQNAGGEWSQNAGGGWGQNAGGGWNQNAGGGWNQNAGDAWGQNAASGLEKHQGHQGKQGKQGKQSKQGKQDAGRGHGRKAEDEWGEWGQNPATGGGWDHEESAGWGKGNDGWGQGNEGWVQGNEDWGQGNGQAHGQGHGRGQGQVKGPHGQNQQMHGQGRGQVREQTGLGRGGGWDQGGEGWGNGQENAWGAGEWEAARPSSAEWGVGGQQPKAQNQKNSNLTTAQHQAAQIHAAQLQAKVAAAASVAQQKQKHQSTKKDVWEAYDEDWGSIYSSDEYDDNRRVHFSPKASELWGGSPRSVPSKSLATIRTQQGIATTPLNMASNVRFVESRGAAFSFVSEAFFGNDRFARERIHWLFPANKDERVAGMLAWVQKMSFNLGTFGLVKFLETRERGALFVNTVFRMKDHPREPAFDWLTFNDLQATMDKTLQESVAFYDPARLVTIFVYLPSQSGKSVAIWRRKVNVPDSTRLKYQAEINAIVKTLRDAKDYVVMVDEVPKPKPKVPQKPGQLRKSMPIKSSSKTHPKGQLQAKEKKKRKWWKFFLS